MDTSNQHSGQPTQWAPATNTHLKSSFLMHLQKHTLYGTNYTHLVQETSDEWSMYEITILYKCKLKCDEEKLRHIQIFVITVYHNRSKYGMWSQYTITHPNICDHSIP